MTDDELQLALDALFGGSLAAFVDGRAALAHRLRAAGRAEAARSVAAVHKPTISSWCINRLWHHHRAPFDAFLDAGDAMRAASGRVGDPHRQAMANRRLAIDELLLLARRELVEGGHGTSTATLRRVQGNLEVLVGYGRNLPRPGPGRMSRDLEPTGFDTLATLGLPGKADLTANEAPDLEAQAREQRAEERQRLRFALRDAGAKVRRAEAEAAAATDRARKAEAIAARAREDLEAAIAREQDLQQRLVKLDPEAQS